jgi:hypothetical protein
MPAFEAVVNTFETPLSFACIEDRPYRHLSKLPRAIPIYFAILSIATEQLIDKHLAKILALTTKHELLGIGFGRFEKVELGVGDDADAFECH